MKPRNVSALNELLLRKMPKGECLLFSTENFLLLLCQPRHNLGEGSWQTLSWACGIKWLTGYSSQAYDLFLVQWQNQRTREKKMKLKTKQKKIDMLSVVYFWPTILPNRYKVCIHHTRTHTINIKIHVCISLLWTAVGIVLLFWWVSQE